jgi:hypothetical protein
MTSIDKTITRICPDITDPQGRELTVTIQPSDQGGEILFHWNRDKKKERDRTFQFRDLASGEVTAPKPKGWGSWVPIEQIKSQLHVLPGVDQATTNLLCGVMDRAAMMQDWLGTETELDFDEFMASRGRGDLVDLPCDKETPEFRAKRLQSEDLQERLNPVRKKTKR